MTPQVGPITLEDADGGWVTDLIYTAHPFVRASELRYRGRWYHQNRFGDHWIYRAVSAVPGDIGTDPDLKETDV